MEETHAAAPRRLEHLALEERIPAHELAGVMALRRWEFGTEVTTDQLAEARAELNAFQIG